MNELAKKADGLLDGIDQAMERLDIAAKAAELAKIRQAMSGSGFWDDSRKAQDLSRQADRLSRQVDDWTSLHDGVKELKDLASLKDESMAAEITSQLEAYESRFQSQKKELQFSGPYDDFDVILSIHAGAGGTDAQDWAQMLLRMYVRWAESQKLKIKTIDQSPGEEAGIKSADTEVTGGSYLYGKLSGEHGVHRLVRLSPFNADHLRQTSFAKVEIMPLINTPQVVELDEKDLKIDVFRAGGHGGQSVNTTDSAVRVTHIPTGVTVAIQNERSQLQNKETAFNILRSKLVQLQLEQHAKNLSDLKGPSQSAEWGNQIRSYVLHPYKQVKDNRSGYESTEVEKVLNGDLGPLIDAWLERR